MAETPLISEENRQRVRDQILSAFEGIPIPEYGELIVPQSADDPAAIRIQDKFAGLDWENITSDLLKRHWPSFGYLTPQAIQYYLPAILIAALDQGDIDLLWASVNELTPSSFLVYNEGSDDRFNEQFSLFTPDQEMAAVGFLGLFLDADQPNPLGFRAGFAFRFGWDRDEWPALHPFAGFYHQMHHFEWPQPDDPETADLVAAILAAFDETPYPGDENICVLEQGDEPAVYALEFQGLDWRTIHPALLAQYYASLSYFTPDGLRYFLPSHLIADLVDVGISTGADPAFYLTQPFSESADTPEGRTERESDEPAPDLFAYSVEQMSAFSRREREAIIRYLEYKAADEYAAPEINEALDRYWRPSLEA